MSKKVFSTLCVLIAILGCGKAQNHQNRDKESLGELRPDRTVLPADPKEPHELQEPRLPKESLEDIEIVRILRAQGIEVEMDWQALRQAQLHRPPGEPSLAETLQIFWRELTDHKNVILEKKPKITKVIITVYTTYRIYQDKKIWFLDYKTKLGQLQRYFPLFEKINLFSEQFNIAFNFIHSGSLTDSHPYKPLRDMVAVLEKNGKELEETQGLFKEVEVDSFSKYYPVSRTLTLSRNRIRSDFARYMKNLKPLGPVYKWAFKNKVEIEADFDLRKEASKVYFAFDLLRRSLPFLEALVQANMLDDITLYFYDTEADYYSALKDLSLGIVTENQGAVTRSLEALGLVGKISQEVRRPIELESSELNEGFHRGVALLAAIVPRLKLKISKIKKIILTDLSFYSPERQELNIGRRSSLREIETILSAIQ